MTAVRDGYKCVENTSVPVDRIEFVGIAHPGLNVRPVSFKFVGEFGRWVLGSQIEVERRFRHRFVCARTIVRAYIEGLYFGGCSQHQNDGGD